MCRVVPVEWPPWLCFKVAQSTLPFTPAWALSFFLFHVPTDASQAHLPNKPLGFEPLSQALLLRDSA